MRWSGLGGDGVDWEVMEKIGGWWSRFVGGAANWWVVEWIDGW